MRAFGGLLYLSGRLVMTVNIWMTIAGQAAREAPMPMPPYDPEADRPRLPCPPNKGKPMTWPAFPVLRTPQEAGAQRHAAGVFALVAVAIGGIVEIAPLFWIDNTIEKVEGVRPYTPLEQAGRDIYIREGCYVCHSQMIRPFRDEVERYGHYSLAAESMYDHPFQWGSKRTGPDLARVGGRYSDEWHVQHLKDPRAVVPESIMPPIRFLAESDAELAT
jgi:hypothetical protein